MRRVVLIALSVLFGAVCMGWVQGEPPAEVTVGGELILRIRFSAGGMTPQQRADAITMRLRTILQDPDIQPADVVVKPIAGGEAGIYVKDQLLITVDRRHAEFHKTTPLKLGEIWAKHLREVIPQVNVKPR